MNPLALVQDLCTQNNTTFLILRPGTSATGFVAERVPHWNRYENSILPYWLFSLKEGPSFAPEICPETLDQRRHKTGAASMN